jgi:hypothetical protein
MNHSTDDDGAGPPYTPDPRQMEIDFPRWKRRAYVEAIVLPNSRSKFLLRVVEGHSREKTDCLLKAKTIAHEMSCHVRTVFRAINDCVSAGLLKVEGERHKDASSRYEILWEGITQTLVDNPLTIHLVAPMEAKLNQKFTCDTPKSTCDTSKVTCDILSGTCDILSGTCDILSTEPGNRTSYPHTRGLKHELNVVVKPHTERHEQPELSDISKVVEAWNRIEGVRPALTMPRNRITAIKARLSDPQWGAHWQAGMDRVAKSSFCRGGGGQGWIADLDWFIRPGKLETILEGKFDERPNGGMVRPDGEGRSKLQEIINRAPLIT